MRQGRRYRTWPEGPLSVAVTLTTSDEVLALRAEVARLKAEAEAAKAAFDRLEFKFRCESIINQELTDLCREKGVDFRPALKARPW